MIDLRSLSYSVTVADHGSFRRAAAALNITQPTLSKRIQEVETRLGIRLFERTTGGARLTAIGEEFVTAARRVLAELENMQNLASAGKRGDAGRLEIGFHTSLSIGMLRDVILTFARKHPQVEVDIIEANRLSLVSLLDRGAIDIIIVLGETACTKYDRLALWSERILVVLPSGHPLAGQEFVYWTELKNQRFLLGRRDPEIGDILVNKLTSPGDRPLIKLVNVNRENILSAVAGERGISLVCESSTGNSMPGLVYREVRDGNGPTRVGYVAFWLPTNENPVLRQFLTMLQSHPAVPTK
jgi:DNA-binding transcriptional LysR family regulator